MDPSFLIATHQPLLVQFLLLFRPKITERHENNYWFVFKTLAGQRYLVDIYHRPDSKGGQYGKTGTR